MKWFSGPMLHRLLTNEAPRAIIPSDGIACDDIVPGATVPDDRTNAPLSAQVFHILLSLVDNDLHGYAIIQDVAARTDDEVSLTASTLYAAIKRLLDSGWIEECRRRPSVDDDARRRYYHLTAQGRQAARAEALRLERLAAMARAKRLIPPLGAPRSASS